MLSACVYGRQPIQARNKTARLWLSIASISSIVKQLRRQENTRMSKMEICLWTDKILWFYESAFISGKCSFMQVIVTRVCTSSFLFQFIWIRFLFNSFLFYATSWYVHVVLSLPHSSPGVRNKATTVSFVLLPEKFLVHWSFLFRPAELELLCVLPVFLCSVYVRENDKIHIMHSLPANSS